MIIIAYTVDVLLRGLLEMLFNLFTKFNANNKYANFYENEFFDLINQPINLLKVKADNSIPVWQKFLQRSNIYCIDNFNNNEPNKFPYLNKDRTFWSRCNIDDENDIKRVMSEIWKKPRFDIIIDNTNKRYNFLKKYCIGKYYVEENDNVRIII